MKDRKRLTTDSHVETLLAALNNTYGYDFHDYKRSSITNRIEHFLAMEGLREVDEILKKIENDKDFFARLIKQFTTNVTSMFRDTDTFRSLRDKIIPQLSSYPTIRIWSAGTGTGEEAYSLAIILKEQNLYHRSLIYATDIDPAGLQCAYKGNYPLEKVSEFTRNYISSGGEQSFSRYYTTDRKRALLDPELKKNIVFASHTLGRDSIFNEFQLILCRNVLIYFNQTLTWKILDLFKKSLCRHGFLCLGTAEDIKFTNVEKYFEEIDGNSKIFRKYV